MFMPKYLENAFDLSPSFSGYLIGTIVIYLFYEVLES